jgi:hypothetical protein
MAQNKVIKGLDNPVVMNFTFTGDFAALGLNTFTSINLDLGDETYTTLLNPNNLFIVSNTELRLRIGDTTALVAGSYLPEIVGFSATYNDGYLISGSCNVVLGSIYVEQC